MVFYQSTNTQYSNQATTTYDNISALPGGGFVVTWVSGLNSGYGSEILGQIYDAAGVPLGSPFVAVPYTDPLAWEPKGNVSVGELENGNFVMGWHQNPVAGANGGGIMARVFAPDWTPLGAAFKAGTYDGFNHISGC